MGGGPNRNRIEYTAGWRGARVCDVILALVLLALLWPILVATGLAVLICDGRPVFYGAERMATVDRCFTLWKFRSMRRTDRGATARLLSPCDRQDVTRLGRFLRLSRLDELPQLWNILRGDMGFVGPRPPLRRYTMAAPQTYARVLRHRPGLTGLATVVFLHHEATLLSRAYSPEEADTIYRRRCIWRKAQLDLVYQRRASPRLDVIIIYLTLCMMLKNTPLIAESAAKRHMLRGMRQI